MVAPFQGGCACKAIRYEVSAEPLAFVLCHCRDCQYVSGGEPAAVVVVPTSAFTLTKGAPTGWTTRADSGNEVTRQFCGQCGAPLFTVMRNPAVWAIKAGSLDDPSWLTPSAFLWRVSAQPWAHMDPTLPAFDKGSRG